MSKTKNRKEKKKVTLPYRTISLPNDFYEELHSYVILNPDYVSIANFVRIACREKIEEDTDRKQKKYDPYIQKLIKEAVRKEIKSIKVNKK